MKELPTLLATRYMYFLQFILITCRYATQTVFLSDLINSAGLGLVRNGIRNLKGISCIQQEATLTIQKATLFPLNL